MAEQMRSHYAGWSKFQLLEACVKAGLKTSGSRDTLQERLETNDEICHLRERLQESGTGIVPLRKRQIMTADEQLKLDVQLGRLADIGSLAQVRMSIASGADVNSICNKLKRSPLYVACAGRPDFDVAELVVRELLDNMASPLLVDGQGFMPIHTACLFSSVNVVKMLLEARSPVNVIDRSGSAGGVGYVPLHYALTRNDGHAMGIVQMLCAHGADLGPVPLACAAYCGTPELVKFMMDRGGSLTNVVRNCAKLLTKSWIDNDTVLIAAAKNRPHGAAIILMLKDDGHVKRTAFATNADGHDAMTVAFAHDNVAAVEALKQVPMAWDTRKFTGVSPPSTSADPLGLVRAAAPFGASFSALGIGFGDHRSWACIRSCPGRIEAVYTNLRVCNSREMWHWAGLEMMTTRRPLDNSTLLHLAAAANNRVGVEALMKIWMNPLLRNDKGKWAVELCTDPALRKTLLAYPNQRPRREVVRWYGPYLAKRLFSWMLVVQHWRHTKLRFIPKDVVLLVVRFVMFIEEL